MTYPLAISVIASIISLITFLAYREFEVTRERLRRIQLAKTTTPQIPILLTKEKASKFRKFAIPPITLSSKLEASRPSFKLKVAVCSIIFTTATFSILTTTDTPHINHLAPKVFALIVASTIAWRIFKRHALEKRRLRLEEELPTVIDSITRSIRSGRTIRNALSDLGTLSSKVLYQEIQEIQRKLEVGMSIGNCFQDWSDKSGSKEIEILALAFKVHEKSGGNLAALLQQLSQTLRARRHLDRRVRTISSEARLSGAFLSAFPFIAIVAINTLDPEYFSEVSQLLIFPQLAAAIAMILVANLLVMKRICSIKI